MFDCSNFHLYIYSMKEKSVGLERIGRVDIKNMSRGCVEYNSKMGCIYELELAYTGIMRNFGTFNTNATVGRFQRKGFYEHI